MKRTSNIIIVLAMLLAGFAESYLWSAGLRAPAVRVSVEALFLAPQRYLGQELIVEGEAIPGSIEARPGTWEYRFIVLPKTQRGELLEGRARWANVQVQYSGLLPDSIFMNTPGACGAVVQLHGTLQDDGVFEATQVLVKCPSKYEATTETSCPAL